MLQIDGYKVFMTKGDTGILSLTIYDKKGELYRPNSNDVCLLTMKKYASQSSPSAQIKGTVDGDNVRFEIMPEDTSNLVCGEYVYDIQVKFGYNGDVNTVIPLSKFVLMQEVTK